MTKWVLQLLFFVITTGEAYAERGIVVAVNDAYAKKYFIGSLEHLRNRLSCDLPIEVWHSGDELSEAIKKVIKSYPNVTICDIADTLQVDPGLYRGWQIKPWIIWLSQFDEVILMDADVFFFENPTSLFDQPGYLQTGAFFFRDSNILMPSSRYSLEKYLDRRKFITTLIPNPSNSVPLDIRKTLWSDTIPTLSAPFPSDLGESGCIAINRDIHFASLEAILHLNENREETYLHVWGDKETYWMGCEIARLPYHMNNQKAYDLISLKNRVHIVQFVQNKLFYLQKLPFKAFLNQARFINNEGYNRQITLDELRKIVRCLDSINRAAKKIPK